MHEGEHVRSRRPPVAAGRLPGQEAPRDAVVGNERPRIHVAREVAADDGLGAVGSEADEVVAPPCHRAVLHRAFDSVETAAAIEVVGHVVFAHPGELHRLAKAFGDGGRFHHEIRLAAPAESAAGAHLVHGDFVRRHRQHLGHGRLSPLRPLSGRPQLNAAVVPPRGGVLGLELGVADERIVIERRESPVGGGERACRRRPCPPARCRLRRSRARRPGPGRRSSCPSRRRTRPTPPPASRGP